MEAAQSAELGRVQEILNRLAVVGHEDWKTPGHPMNAWVGRDVVNSLAAEALQLVTELIDGSPS